MSSAEVMAINNELKRKPVGILDNMNAAKQIKLDKNKFATSTKNSIPNYTPLDNNTQNEKLNSSSKINEYLSNHYIVNHAAPTSNHYVVSHTATTVNPNAETCFVTQPPKPVTVDYCETCNHVLQHCKGCLDHTKLCGNPHCGNRQKGTTFCVACKGLDEYHPICRNCVEYPPYTAQTNQCAHCKGYFCAASLSNPSLKYACEACEGMVCWRCRTNCQHTAPTSNPTILQNNDTSNTKASVNIDILMK